MSGLQAKICFVTGGSGYIGRNVIRELIKRGAEVRALARSPSSAEKVEAAGAVAILGDLADVGAMQAGMTGADWLVHAAADTDHDRSTAAQEKANLDGTRNVYQAARQSGVKRVIHISTEAVLLDGNPLINADETEPYPKRYAGGYSRTKAGAEQIAPAASCEAMEVIVIRPRFVWGRDDTTALPQLIEAARSGKLAWIGGGNYLISTTHIANLVHGIMLALEAGQGGEFYFITDGEPIMFREFITRLLETQNVSPPEKAVPRWLVRLLVKAGEGLAALTGGVLKGSMSWQEYATLGVQVTLNIDKARNQLGYAPIISREEGLRELA